MRKFAVAYAVLGAVLAVVLSVGFGLLITRADISRTGSPVISKAEFMYIIHAGGWPVDESAYDEAVRTCEDPVSYGNLRASTEQGVNAIKSLDGFQKRDMINSWVYGVSSVC
jgi:hypothetical protein